MSKGGEQIVEADCTKDDNTSTPSLIESDQSVDGTGVQDTPPSSLIESDQSVDGTGVNDTPPSSLIESDQSRDVTGVNNTPPSSLTQNIFWRDQKFWIQIAILGTIQLYVFYLYLITFTEK